MVSLVRRGVVRTGGVAIACALVLAGSAGTQQVGAGVAPVRAGVPDSIPVPPPLVREFRGAWLSPVEGGAWPSRPGMSVAEQQAELRAVLDSAAAFGLNAILLHVRIAGDAMYPSARAPWSRYLVGPAGTPGADWDGWDPLAFAVREAHARGLELHAWFNPFRASTPDDVGPPLAAHVTRRHPAWVRRYGDLAWIDPGIPDARRSVLDAILEVVGRYDIDGVHIDDYFYPYQQTHTVTHLVGRGRHRHRVHRTVLLPFPDAASWKRYGRARGWTSRADWRRANIDSFVHTLYERVHTLKPWLLVGVSPFGIWRPGSPPGITGLDSYSEIFADSRKWLREGWLDYLAPQLYWPLDNSQQRFTRLDAWWRSQNVHHRHIWPGLLTTGIEARTDPWPLVAIAQEIDTLRDVRTDPGESRGHVHFRMRALLQPLEEGAPSPGRVLRRNEYAAPAIPPASPWLGDAVPAAPRVAWAHAGPLVLAGHPAANAAAPGAPAPPTAALPPVASSAVAQSTVAQPADAPAASHVLTITPADSVRVRWWAVQSLAPDGRWSLRLVPAGTREISIAAPGAPRPRAVVVRAISSTGMASAPAALQAEGP